MDRPTRAVFIDRDGVINANRLDHVKDWHEFQFLAGSLDALARLASTGLPVFVVTNQAVINRGLVPRRVIDDINSRMEAVIADHGGRVDAVLCCPHAPEEHCQCRKPQPGLLIAAANRFRLDLKRCFLIGDALTDIMAGQAVGCDTILVLTGRGLEQHNVASKAAKNGYRLARDLGEAVELIRREIGAHMVNNTSRYVKSPNLVSRKIQDEMILVPIRNSVGDLQHIYTLNEVGSRVWELLDESHNAADLEESILAEFSEATPDQVQDDLARFITQLAEIGAIEVLSAASET